MKKDDVKIKLPNLIKENPVAAAVISKLNKDNRVTTISPQNSNIQTIAMSISDKIKSNEDIVQLFPDTELCIQILTSSIISPNDMINNKIKYIAPDLKLPSSIKDTILQEIEIYIESEYEINSKLPNILRESLFTKGAYVEAIIPEASLDDIISQYQTKPNVSSEHFASKYIKPTYQFIGKDTTDYYVTGQLSTESDKNFNLNFSVSMNGNTHVENNKTFKITQEDLNIEITDNYKILNMSKYLVKNIKKNVNAKLHGTTLSIEDELELNNWFKPAGNFSYKEYIGVKTKDDASRESLGKPLIMKLPVETVIPVHVVNNPSKHLGYFVLLDENGTPIFNPASSASDTEYTDFININNDNKLNLIQKARAGLFGMTKKEPLLNNLDEVYSSIAEKMLKDKLKNGLFGDLVDIKENYELYRVMLNRALRNQNTKILFLPAELVSYYAFDFRENGTGKSLLEKSSVLYSIRAILLFSRIMAYLKNSTTITEVSTVIDEKDPNPDSTMEMIKSETLKLRQAAIPLGITAVNDLQEWISMSGMRFKFQHPGLPATEISTSDMSTSKTIPDDELDRIIKEYIIMSFGLTPEIVEAGYNSDFATTVTAKNLLLAKRTTQMQNLFVPQIAEHIRKLLSNDSLILTKIKQIVENNFTEIKKYVIKNKNDENNIKLDKIGKSKLINYIVEKFIYEIDVSLPRPETQEANNIKQAFEDYEATLNTVMDLMFSADSFPADFAGDISNHTDQLKSMFKTVLIKTWISNNNFLPELSQFLTKDEDGKPTFNILTDYTSFLDSVSEAFIPFMKTRAKKVAKLNEKISKATEGSSGDSGDDYDNDSENQDDEYNNNEEGDEPTDETTDDGGETDGDNTDTDGGFDSGDGDDGGDDMDLNDDDDADMGGDFGDEGGSDGDSGDSGPSESEEELAKAKIETEKARAEKIKTETELKKQQIQELNNEKGMLSDMDNSVMDADDESSNNDNDTSDSSTNANNSDGKGKEQQTDTESKIKIPHYTRPYTSDLM